LANLDAVAGPAVFGDEFLERGTHARFRRGFVGAFLFKRARTL
jgi:hypothetical protein